MNKLNEICEISKTNEAILYDLRRLMCGVINNRYNKSKGFQFALLHKNFDRAEALIWHNIQRIKD